MRTLESRLRELVESTKYQKDFGELKKNLLKSKAEYPFIKTDLQKSIEAGVMCREHIPLKEIQTLLRTGNINGHFIHISETYSDFKNKYKLRFFFDPSQPYPEDGFSPFDDKPVTASLPGDGGTKIQVTVDISYPSRVLVALLQAEIKSLKEMWKLKEERKERYSDDEVHNAKKLMREGLSDIEIFRKICPKHKKFSFTKDYEIGGKTPESLEAVAAERRVRRLLKKAKGRMD